MSQLHRLILGNVNTVAPSVGATGARHRHVQVRNSLSYASAPCPACPQPKAAEPAPAPVTPAPTPFKAAPAPKAPEPVKKVEVSMGLTVATS